MRQPCFLSQVLAHIIELALAQDSDKVAADTDLISFAADQAAFNEPIDSPVKRSANLSAKSGAREIGSLAGDQTPIEPGRAFRDYLLIEIQVRTDGKRNALPALRILKTTQFDDAADRTIAGCLEVGQLEVMHTSVDPVHHSERCSPQLVIVPAGEETTDHGFAVGFAFKRP